MAVREVLVVDDSATELYYMQELLTKNGFVVHTANNGEDAMRLIQARRPDLIVMDVVMPGQNGYQLTRAISKDPNLQSIPIFMCSSKNQESDRIWGLKQGAQEYFVKPVQAADFVARIRAL